MTENRGEPPAKQPKRLEARARAVFDVTQIRKVAHELIFHFGIPQAALELIVFRLEVGVFALELIFRFFGIVPLFDFAADQIARQASGNLQCLGKEAHKALLENKSANGVPNEWQRPAAVISLWSLQAGFALPSDEHGCPKIDDLR